MKRVFSILTFIALAMVIASFLATTPPGLAAIGKVLCLDGEGDYVEVIQDIPEINFTIELQFRTLFPNVGIFGVLAGPAGEAGHDRHIHLQDGFLSQRIYDGEAITSAHSGFNDGLWHHYAMVVEQGIGQKMYVDGQIEASGSKDHSDFDWQDRFWIGFSNDALDKFFAGQIDEVRIWKYARTQEQIQDAMNRTLTDDEINSGNVVGYWNFDDGDARDLSPNHNDGTLMGDARIGDFMANFVAEPRWGEAPLTVEFTDCSYGESITGWRWDFGDGDTSSKQNPLHTYQDAGDYTVSLTITNPEKSDTFTRSQYIHVGAHLEYDQPTAGVIEPPGDIDTFCFSANGNDIIVLDVDAQSKGSPLNSYLRLYDLSGRELAYNDDTTGSLDSLIVYRIPNTGTYCVEIGDTDGNGGSDYTYTLSLRLGSSIKGNVSGGVVMHGGEERQYTPLESAEAWAENIGTSQQFQIWTDAYGNYELLVPEGSYRVKMRTSDVLQYFNRTTNPDNATIVTVGAGSPATGINFSFEINNFLFREFISENGYLTRGLVLGPLRNVYDINQDYLASIGGEANVIPREGDTFEHEGDVLKWRAYNFGIGGNIFDQMFGYVEPATVYVAVYLKFDEAGTVDLWVGHDDAGAVWFNGKNVWTYPGWRWPYDEIQLTVKKGWNRMLVKVCENGGAWGMSVRFPNVKPIDISLNPDVIKTIGDVSGNGTISAYDASLILQFVVGLIDELPPPKKSPADGVLRDYSVSIPELTTRPGNRIKVPVAINDVTHPQPLPRGEFTRLTAGGIILKYDSSVIRAVDALPTSMLSGAYWKANTQKAGEVRFAFAAAEPIKGAGNLLTVEFEPLGNTAGLESPLVFETVQFAESKSIRTIDGRIVILPEKSMLMQNYPNPFNPETWIPYQLAEDSPVTISIYNAKGEIVRNLNLGYQSAGIYVAKSKAAYWDGRDNLGEKVANGVYFYKLQAGNFYSVRKLVVVK